MKRLLLPLFLFTVISVFAQNAPGKSEQEKKYAAGNFVKWDFSLLSRGALSVSYERKLVDFLSLQAGGGITYMDPLSELAVLDYYPDVTKKFTGGYLFSGMLKFYPRGTENMEGMYLSPVFRYRTYNSIESYADFYTDINGNTVNLSETYKQNMLATDMALMLGYQFKGETTGIMWEAYIGAGWTNKTYNEIAFEAINEFEYT